MTRIVAVFALVGCTASPSATRPAEGSSAWVELSPLPHALQEVGVVARADGTVWVIGGFDDQGFVRDEIWIFDLERTWRQGPYLPEALHHANLAELDGDLYLLGALSGPTFRPLDTSWRLDAGSTDWTPLAPVPTPIGASAVGVVGRSIQLAGGLTGQTTARALTYDVDADAWSPLPDLPEARDHGNGAGGDVLLAIGGRENGLSQVRDDVWACNGATWQTRAPLPTARAGAAAARLPSGEVIVIGGEGSDRSGGVFDEVELYDPAADRWRTLPSLPYGLHGTGAAPFGDGVLVPGGADRQAFAAVDTVLFLPL